MCGCGLFNARVWLGCLRSGIELVKAHRLDDAEPELVKAFVAGKLFFREHEVTIDAISVLADTASVMFGRLAPWLRFCGLLLTGCCVGALGAMLSSLGPPFGLGGAEVPCPFPPPGPPTAMPPSVEGVLVSGVASGVGRGLILDGLACLGRSTTLRLFSCCIMSNILVLLGTL